MLHINIPKPCHENWQNMRPTQKGAWCGLCREEVIDFSRMTDDEVRQYLIGRQNQRICGRFEKQQLQRLNLTIDPAVVRRLRLWWKRFLAMLLICFGMFMTGCHQPDQKKAAQQVPAINTVQAPQCADVKVGGFIVHYDSTAAMPGPDKVPAAKKREGTADDMERMRVVNDTAAGDFVPVLSDTVFIPPGPDDDVELFGFGQVYVKAIMETDAGGHKRIRSIKQAPKKKRPDSAAISKKDSGNCDGPYY